MSLELDWTWTGLPLDNFKRKNNKRFSILPDDKKGVDRASTVVARETNEGTVTW